MTFANSSPVAADREFIISRTIHGPRRLVFEAFTDPAHLGRWWGPNGFTTTTRTFEFRPGGVWDFTMHGPDGVDYPNWIEWREIVPPERLVYLHGENDDDPRKRRLPAGLPGGASRRGCFGAGRRGGRFAVERSW